MNAWSICLSLALSAMVLPGSPPKPKPKPPQKPVVVKPTLPVAPPKFPPLLGQREQLPETLEVSKYTDLKTTDACYAATKDLVEKFGCLSSPTDRKLHPEMECTSGEILLLLNNSLNRLNDVLSSLEKEKGEKAFEEIFSPLTNHAESPLLSVSQIKTLSEKSPYFVAVQSLVKRYRSFITSDVQHYGDFNPVSKLELSKFAKYYFGNLEMEKSLARLSAKEQMMPTTRREMLIMVGNGINKLYAKISKP